MLDWGSRKDAQHQPASAFVVIVDERMEIN